MSFRNYIVWYRARSLTGFGFDGRQNLRGHGPAQRGVIHARDSKRGGGGSGIHLIRRATAHQGGRQRN